MFCLSFKAFYLINGRRLRLESVLRAKWLKVSVDLIGFGVKRNNFAVLWCDVLRWW
jgi:hypothetical protein